LGIAGRRKARVEPRPVAAQAAVEAERRVARPASAVGAVERQAGRAVGGLGRDACVVQLDRRQAAGARFGLVAPAVSSGAIDERLQTAEGRGAGAQVEPERRAVDGEPVDASSQELGNRELDLDAFDGELGPLAGDQIDGAEPVDGEALDGRPGAGDVELRDRPIEQSLGERHAPQRGGYDGGDGDADNRGGAGGDQDAAARHLIFAGGAPGGRAPGGMALASKALADIALAGIALAGIALGP
jgi:hypothetical protein